MVEEAVKHTFQQYYIENALEGTEVDILWGSIDLDCNELKSVLEESVGLKCETESTDEKDCEEIHLLNLNFPFCIYLFLLIK